MSCKQIDEFLLSYLDPEEILPEHWLEIKSHLDICPQCQGRVEYALRERDALRFDEDIPPLSGDFTQKVMAAINQIQPQQPNPWANKFAQGFNRNSLWVAGLAAAVLISWLMLPDLQKETNQSSTTTPIITREEKLKLPSGAAFTDIAPETKSTPENSVNESTTFNTRIAEDQQSRKSVSSSRSTSLSTSEDMMLKVAVPDSDEEVTLWLPGYIPSDYYLALMENDADKNATLHYQNGRGGFISFKITAKPVEASPLETGSGVAPQAPAEVCSVDKTASNVMNWTKEEAGTTYELELTSNLPPDEFNKVAESVQ